MPNTKSAARRARNSVRRQVHNRAIKSSLKTIEKSFLATVKAGDKAKSETAFRATVSAFDKAVKSGVIPKGNADRKKSRLAVRLGALK